MCNRQVTAMVGLIERNGAMVGEHITLEGEAVQSDHAIVEQVTISAPPAPQCDWPHDSASFWQWINRL